MHRRTLLAGVVAATGAAALAACAGDDAPATDAPTTDAPTTGAPADEPYVPGSTWETVTPEEAGWSSEGLDALLALVEASNSTTCTVVAGGRLLAEEYWAGATPTTPQDIASCQKSVVSTLVGIARTQGLLELDDPVTDHLGPGWTAAAPDEEAAITVRHLLSMTSGLDQDTLTVVAPPGTRWAYNTTAYQKLRPVLEAATGQGIDEVTRQWLWDPIGVSTASTWAPRGGGPFSVDATGAELWGLSMTATDMARFGLLTQRRGSWGGTTVVEPGWYDEALVASQPHNPSYGYLWWLNGDRPQYPGDLVAALGAADQKIYVIPSLDVVLTRQGGSAGALSETASGFDGQVLDLLVAARR